MASGDNDVINRLSPLVFTEKEVDYFLNAMEAVLENNQEVSGEGWKTIFQIAKRTLKRSDNGNGFKE